MLPPTEALAIFHTTLILSDGVGVLQVVPKSPFGLLTIISKAIFIKTYSCQTGLFLNITLKDLCRVFQLKH